MSDDYRCGRQTASTKKPCRRFRLDPFLGCVTHLTADERKQYEQRKAEEAAAWAPYWEVRTRLLNGQPSCWGWTVTHSQSARALTSLTADTQFEAEGTGSVVLDEWQAGRCAICGEAEPLVVDHDHQSGLVRGLLCRRCNTNEGIDGRPATVYQRYRELPPTRILGVRLRYWDPYTRRHSEPVQHRAYIEEADAFSASNPLAQINAAERRKRDG